MRCIRCGNPFRGYGEIGQICPTCVEKEEEAHNNNTLAEHQGYDFFHLKNYLKEVYYRTPYTLETIPKIRHDIEMWIGRLVQQGDLSERMRNSTIEFLLSIITIEK